MAQPGYIVSEEELRHEENDEEVDHSDQDAPGMNMDAEPDSSELEGLANDMSRLLRAPSAPYSAIAQLNQDIVVENGNNPPPNQPNHQNGVPIQSEEPPLHPNWLAYTSHAIKLEKKFTGELSDKKRRLEDDYVAYQRAIKHVMFEARLPSSKRSFVAMKLLDGPALHHINTLDPNLFDEHGNLPFDVLMTELHKLVDGTALGELSFTEQLLNFDFLATGVKYFDDTNSIPDINVVIQTLKREFQQVKPMADMTELWRCIIIQRALRTIPSIREAVRLENTPGHQVKERIKSEPMFTALLSHNGKFRQAVEQAIARRSSGYDNNKKRRHGVDYPISSSAAGPSRPSNRPASTPHQHRSTHKTSAPIKGGWSPFDNLPKERISHSKPTNDTNNEWVPWIKGQPLKVSQALPEGTCWLCKKKGHSILTCSSQKSKFEAKAFAWIRRK